MSITMNRQSRGARYPYRSCEPLFTERRQLVVALDAADYQRLRLTSACRQVAAGVIIREAVERLLAQPDAAIPKRVTIRDRKQIAFSMDATMLDAIHRVASQQGVSDGGVVRTALIGYLDYLSR